MLSSSRCCPKSTVSLKRKRDNTDERSESCKRRCMEQNNSRCDSIETLIHCPLVLETEAPKTSKRKGEDHEADSLAPKKQWVDSNHAIIRKSLQSVRSSESSRSKASGRKLKVCEEENITNTAPALEQLVDTITHIPRLSTLLVFQDQGTLLSHLRPDLGSKTPSQEQFTPSNLSVCPGVSEYSKVRQASDSDSILLVTESPIFNPRTLFIQHWQTLGSDVGVDHSIGQSHEWPNSTPLTYNSPNFYEYPSQEPLAFNDRRRGFLTLSGEQHGAGPGTDDSYSGYPTPNSYDNSMIDPMLLCVHKPSDVFSKPLLPAAPRLNDNSLSSSTHSMTIPKSKITKNPGTSPGLPPFCQFFDPVPANSKLWHWGKPKLPYALKKQVSLLAPIQDRSRKSLIDTHYDDDDFRISRAGLSSGEIRLRYDKVLGKYQVHSEKIYDASSCLRNCVTIIQDEEEKFRTELERDLQLAIEEE
ncbi:uncharacterized protein RCO7_01601 [Rhynchosporium graminicola]|uniref:Uncharacterized protein n=1 Tax=Rhynchosporium graminicola TaxID=2792576 RepID=A0A1E1LRR0_9HELO|nr:uncharacterized protein RCO7_01601 [Rhynchosporium commune]